MRFEERIGLRRFLEAYPGMRVLPSSGDTLRLKGGFAFEADYEGGPLIKDEYQLQIDVHRSFPDTLPVVRELGGRIPRHADHHVYADGALCLGSPLRLHLLLHAEPDLVSFARRCILPYLYAATHREEHGAYPFGELSHGRDGLLNDYARIFDVDSPEQAAATLSLLGIKRRLANKHPCPCGCGRRLGVCKFNARVRELREQYGRPLFKRLYAQVR